MGILRTDVVSHSQLSNGNASVLFDGTTDSITIPSHSAFAFGTADWTVEGWFYFTSLSGQQTLVGDTYGSTAGWYLYKQDNHRLGVYYSSLLVDGNTLIETDRWYHLAFVRHSGRTRIYINGELDAEGADTTNATVTQYYIADTADQTSGEFFGYISNLRITRTAVYTTNFTVPKFKLKQIPGTILLCCQSSSSTIETTVSVPGTLTANGDPTATNFGPGLKEDITDTGVVFDGFTVLATSTYMIPPSGKTRERNRGRAAVGGGYDGSSVRGEIEYFNIQSMGIAIDFGNLTTTTFALASNAASSTRGIIAVGGRTPSYVNTIEFITIANTSNATDFGDTSATGGNIAASSNQTRGILMGGRQPTRNTIELITIATVGNASDFGDLTAAKRQGASLSSPTRAIYAGGFDDTNRINNIEFVTIASTGNATDFGDLTDARQSLGGASDNTRGVFAGGYDAPARVNIIDFITMASAGNASDFGDTASARDESTGTSNNTRGVFAGFNDGGRQNNIYFVTIQTTGNASDFGDLKRKRTGVSNCSDSHGGLS